MENKLMKFVFREIRFRCWNEGSKKMFENVGLTPTECIVYKHTAKMIEPEEDWRFGRDTVRLMQFTGLLDKNGREIYEGDIIEFTDKWEWYRTSWASKFLFANEERKKELQKEFEALPTEKREVTIDFTEGLNFSTHDLREGRWQVIGNVYENPEILNSPGL